MPKLMASKGVGDSRKNMVCKGVGTKKLPLSLVVTASVTFRATTRTEYIVSCNLISTDAEPNIGLTAKGLSSR